MQGILVWQTSNTLQPYQAWVIPVDPAYPQADVSLTVISTLPIVGERHCHAGTEVLAFPGASPETKTAGTRLFFPETVYGCHDNFRFLNITEYYAFVTVISRDINGFTVRRFTGQIPPLGFWIFTDNEIGNVQGTLEIFSTQPVVGERHLHYGNGVAVGQLGQVLS
ncbi:TPA: hypothetical protein ENX78_07590 [Candidatus Poribacteria bacterium]|nr:hypothetical protein [Candidatus Poribacteria bacterium]